MDCWIAPGFDAGRRTIRFASSGFEAPVPDAGQSPGTRFDQGVPRRRHSRGPPGSSGGPCMRHRGGIRVANGHRRGDGATRGRESVQAGWPAIRTAAASERLQIARERQRPGIGSPTSGGGRTRPLCALPLRELAVVVLEPVGGIPEVQLRAVLRRAASGVIAHGAHDVVLPVAAEAERVRRRDVDIVR